MVWFYDIVPATYALAGITLLLVVVGLWQITAVRRENKLERTLAICSRYEADPIVEGCVRRLRPLMETNTLLIQVANYEQDIVVLLNFLDTIAIGIQQKLFDENLAYDHTATIVDYWYREILNNYEVARAAGVSRNDYDRLCKMAERWSNVEPRFNRGWRGWLWQV